MLEEGAGSSSSSRSGLLGDPACGAKKENLQSKERCYLLAKKQANACQERSCMFHAPRRHERLNVLALAAPEWQVSAAQAEAYVHPVYHKQALHLLSCDSPNVDV